MSALRPLQIHAMTLQDTFEKEAVMEKLIQKTPTRDWEPRATGTRNAAILADARKIPESAASLYLKDLYKLTVPVDLKAASFTDQMSRLIKQVRLPPCLWRCCASIALALSARVLLAPLARTGVPTVVCACGT
jgi:hypothetical protein